MRICVVGPTPPPSGGMAVQTKQLVSLLSAEGHQIQLVATNAPYKPRFVAKVPGIRAVFRLIPYLFTLFVAIRRADVVHMMANSGWSWHLFAVPTVWIARLLRTPVVINYRGGHAGEFFDRSWRWVKPTISRASRVIVPSGFLKDVFARYQLTADVIPNILDTRLFKPSGQPPSLPHLISTRNLEAIYGNDVILRAFAKILHACPEATLTIAGSGPEEPTLKALAHQLAISDRVTFSGRLDQQGIVALYQSATLLLNASRIDNSPNSLIEAMACGVPVISTRAGGIPYLIEHQQSGYLVTIDDAEQMAECAIALIQDSETYENTRNAALKRVEVFHQDKVLAQWQNCYQALVTAKDKQR